MRFLSYAQELEDIILYDVLKDYENGFYIDVGANDPWDISVTKAFYERGFHGINIEPLTSEYEKLIEDRPRDINLCVGVGKEETELILYEMGTGSTFDANIVKTSSKNDDSIPQKVIKITTLSNICDEWCPPPQEIHFCKIDVEGFERDVLLGMNFDKYRPYVIVMESAEPGTTVSSHEKWESILLENNYRLAYAYGVNRYYTDQCSDIGERFIGVEKLLEKYQIYKPISITKNDLGSLEIMRNIIYYSKLLPRALITMFKKPV